MATTESADSEVVVELGVPGPSSDGVAGSEGGGGTAVVEVSVLLTHGNNDLNLRLIRVGPRDAMSSYSRLVERLCADRVLESAQVWATVGTVASGW